MKPLENTEMQILGNIAPRSLITLESELLLKEKSSASMEDFLLKLKQLIK